MSEPSDKPILIPAPTPQRQDLPERRRATRFPFTASAEVRDLRSQASVTGRCSDLANGGCYVDTLSPFGIGSAVRVQIERDLRKFEALAIVSYAHLSMGMGLAFTEVKPEHQAVLRSWIAELSGEQPSGPEAPAAGPEAGLPATIESLRQVINELVNLMVRKKILTETEAAGVLRQLLR
jgi:PilZ domain